jgi:hypothetical protein
VALDLRDLTLMKKKRKKKKPLNTLLAFSKRKYIYRKKKSKMMGLFGETRPSPVLDGLFTLL